MWRKRHLHARERCKVHRIPGVARQKLWGALLQDTSRGNTWLENKDGSNATCATLEGPKRDARNTPLEPHLCNRRAELRAARTSFFVA